LTSISIRLAGLARFTTSHSLMSKAIAAGAAPLWAAFTGISAGSYAAEQSSALQRPVESTMSLMLPERESDLL
jgi:hypothetical protein